MALEKKILSRERRFSLVLTEQFSELLDCFQLLISVFIFNPFFNEGGASVPQFSTQQCVPWRVLCLEHWDSG